MATTVNLGKVSVTPRGSYSPSAAYSRLDITNYGGSAFIALKDVQGITPVEGEYWKLLVSKGDKGDKGDKGNQGDPPSITSQLNEYQAGTSGTNVPTGAWSTAIPVVPQGDFLWVRTTIQFSNSSPLVMYSVSRDGVDGTGIASDTAALPLASTASSGTSSSLSRSDHVHPYPTPANIGAVPTTRTVDGVALSNNVTTVLKFISPTIPTPTNNPNTDADPNSVYPYRYAISCNGVTSSMFSEVVFDVPTATSGVFSPVSDCASNTVYIWAKNNTTQPTILSIFVHR
jgi:hypothetical protein